MGLIIAGESMQMGGGAVREVPGRTLGEEALILIEEGTSGGEVSTSFLLSAQMTAREA